MRSTVNTLGTLVLVTFGTACAPRAARVVQMPVLSGPVSTAYDVDAHAARGVERDQAHAAEIDQLKAEVLSLAHFDFFWDPEQLVYPIVRAGWWEPADRALIREKVARILALVTRRRAFRDDEALRWSWARARETVAIFDQRAALDRSLAKDGVKRD